MPPSGTGTAEGQACPLPARPDCSCHQAGSSPLCQPGVTGEGPGPETPPSSQSRQAGALALCPRRQCPLGAGVGSQAPSLPTEAVKPRVGVWRKPTAGKISPPQSCKRSHKTGGGSRPAYFSNSALPRPTGLLGVWQWGGGARRPRTLIGPPPTPKGQTPVPWTIPPLSPPSRDKQGHTKPDTPCQGTG